MRIVIGFLFKLSEAFSLNPFDWWSHSDDHLKHEDLYAFDPETKCNKVGECKDLVPYVDDCLKRCGEGGWCWDDLACGYCCSADDDKIKQGLNGNCPSNVITKIKTITDTDKHVCTGIRPGSSCGTTKEKPFTKFTCVGQLESHKIPTAKLKFSNYNSDGVCKVRQRYMFYVYHFCVMFIIVELRKQLGRDFI